MIRVNLVMLRGPDQIEREGESVSAILEELMVKEPFAYFKVTRIQELPPQKGKEETDG